VNGPGVTLPLFAATGIEIEYMLVSRDSQDVLPVADQVLRSATGDYDNEYSEGHIAWSNELVLHVLELKTNGPATRLAPLADQFRDNIRRINGILQDHGGKLLPTAMHPWMNPALHTRLWPHGDKEIYRAFDRIFNCQGHGWSNLQSMHINLPFTDDREFARLHTAIRALLPIMPAFAASSPLREGELTGMLDTRLETYRHNARRVPEVAGLVIPEHVTTRDDYEAIILTPMYEAIRPHDPAGVLRYEWLNSRGAIARFERNTIEIRVLDTQETPAADLAIAGFCIAVLKALIEHHWGEPPPPLTTPGLAAILHDTIRHGERAVIRDPGYLNMFGFPGKKCEATELGYHLLETLPRSEDEDDKYWRPVLRFILDQGTLASRICRSVGPGARRSYIEETYRVLSACLVEGRLFDGIG
jgi:gamma-glutamyl:cysteine ligase YbdK (ATP-grasp superfamily)